MHVSATLDVVGDDHAYLADIVVAEFMNLQTCSAGNEDFTSCSKVVALVGKIIWALALTVIAIRFCEPKAVCTVCKW